MFKLFEGLSNLGNPSHMWALSDHMIFWLIILPIAGVLFLMVLPGIIIGLMLGMWNDDYDN